MVQAGPVLHTSQVQDPAAGNGQGSNVQMFMPTISYQIAAQPGYFGGGSIFQAMARQPTSFPGFMPGGSSGYIPAQVVNPLYANIGVQPGHQTLYSPALMPAPPVSRAEFSRPLEHMAARTGEARAEKAPRDLPFLLPPVYDHLTPKSKKPKDYKEGGQSVKFDTFSGMQDKLKALTLLQQFDAAFTGGNFSEPSMVRKVATFLKGNALHF